MHCLTSSFVTVVKQIERLKIKFWQFFNIQYFSSVRVLLF